MKYLLNLIFGLLASSLFGVVSLQAGQAGLLIDQVWSGHPVGFDLLTERDHQFIAYYDAQRRLTVAGRKLSESTWTKLKPEGVMVPKRDRMSNVIGWDSHNRLEMALDAEGCLHLSGNMHNDPLVYYRTRVPFDVSTLERIDRMTGNLESAVTYPHFFKNAEGDLIFRYRHGGSGKGGDYYNIYDLGSRQWSRLIDGPLLDGGGERNAYSSGPVRSSDGTYHMVWMWRDTSDAASNHTLSYAHSLDLKGWQSSRGEPLKLPITIQTGEVIDAAKPGEGLINMTYGIGFDAMDQPIVAYHRYDADGASQAYVARVGEDGSWLIRALSDWDIRWDFSGGGSISAEVKLGALTLLDDGSMQLSYSARGVGKGRWRFDSETLEVLSSLPAEPKRFESSNGIDYESSNYPGMLPQSIYSQGQGSHWVLRWETLGRNRDQAREIIPPQSELRLYEVSSF